MGKNEHARHTTGVIGRTLRLMLGALLCWMAYTVMSGQNTAFNLNVLWVFGGVLIFYLLVHLGIHRFCPALHPWYGALAIVFPILVLFVFGGQPGRVAAVGYVGISILLLAAKGNGVNVLLFLPALLSGKETHIGCLLFAPIDLIEKNLSGPGGMPG